MSKSQILVVEDEGITLLHLTKTLESLGYEVAAVANSGDDAIMKATEARPDLVLMDIVLKGAVDGIDAAEKIRAILNIPVIYLTAHADEATLERAKMTEPFGYIVKPFRERDLQIAIEFALYKSKMELEMRKLNRSLQRRASDLEGAFKDMETFSCAVSHDLMAPLRVIEGFSATVLEDYADKLDEKGRKMLDRIRGNTEKMRRLIDDLLEFSRVSTKGIHRSEINLEAMTTGVIRELETTAGGKNIRFELKNMPVAFGDPSMIRQVLVNLLSNAVKFTRTKDTAIIEAGGHENGNENVYYVKDSGVGFDMKFADKLFILFQRIHAAHQFEGTGVGLVIVKKIIEKHGGRVWAEGRQDEGATFYFALPRKKD